MPVKRLATLLLIFPAMVYAVQEEDIDLFEFLAMYDQSDSAFIDAEMDERIDTVNADAEDNLTSQDVMKSESDEQ